MDGYESEWIPPYPFNKRMWSGAKMHFQIGNPLRIGQSVTEDTKMESIDIKETARGTAIFTTLCKLIGNDYGECLREYRRIVYMKDTPDQNQQQRIIRRNLEPDFTFSITPTTMCLFRYSALTFNSHMIHYDLDYARNKEGYRNVLVHGQDYSIHHRSNPLYIDHTLRRRCLTFSRRMSLLRCIR